MKREMKREVTMNGTPFLWLTGLLFVALKLTEHIDWSWWLVLLPFYLPLVIMAGFFMIVGLVFMFGMLIALLSSR